LFLFLDKFDFGFGTQLCVVAGSNGLGINLEEMNLPILVDEARPVEKKNRIVRQVEC